LTVPPSLDVGVGHTNNEASVSPVFGIDGESWNNVSLVFVANSFQVRDATLEPQGLINKASHVLSNNEPWPNSFNNSEHFWPEIAVIFCALLSTGLAPRLTREASADNIGSNKFSWIEGFDVIIYRHLWKSECQYFLAVFVLFDEAHSLKLWIGHMKAKSKATDTRK
jgi:hypothetical protein